MKVNDTKPGSGNAAGGGGRQRRRLIISAAGAVVVIGVAAFIVLTAGKRAPLRATILEVDDTSVTMGYFLKRASFSAAEPDVVLQSLVEEQLVMLSAPLRPYAIDVTDEEVQRLLREQARGERETISENDFRTWYRQELAKTPFTDREFRDLVRRNLLRQRFTEALAERIPTVAPQVHLAMITRRTAEDAVEVLRRLDAGEDFRELAREVNLDGQLREQGGDMGWYPRAALPETVAAAVFDALEAGQYSQPLVIDQQQVAIIMVEEKAAARQVDERMLLELKANALERWLQQELPNHRVVVHGLHGGWDEETEAWIRWQLQHMRN